MTFCLSLDYCLRLKFNIQIQATPSKSWSLLNSSVMGHDSWVMTHDPIVSKMHYWFWMCYLTISIFVKTKPVQTGLIPQKYQKIRFNQTFLVHHNFLSKINSEPLERNIRTLNPIFCSVISQKMGISENYSISSTLYRIWWTLRHHCNTVLWKISFKAKCLFHGPK